MDNELYRYWREVLRNQLGISAHLFMIFASGILGYTINLILSSNKVDLKDFPFTLIFLSLVSLLLSISIYCFFIFNRLQDFRKTAKYIKEGKSEAKIRIITKKIGDCTWILFIIQVITFLIGVTLSLISFWKIICSNIS